MNDFPYDLHESLGFMAITANRLMNALLHRKMKAAGLNLTGEQWGVLVLLWNRQNSIQEELALRLCVEKSSMSRVLSCMERNGLIARRVDPADTRRKIIRPTQKANRLKERSLAVAREVLALTCAGIDPEDYACCLKVLAKAKANLRKHGK